MTASTIKSILEAAIFAAEDPLTIEKLMELFPQSDRPEKKILTATLEELAEDYQGRGVELICVASGYRFQARSQYADWLKRLWQQRTPKYSRALLETLALIAYKQPLTRGEIEQVRGVAVSSNMVKTLLDREWIKMVGHRDVPGKPALLATTKGFLDYFNLRSLSDLPTLSDLMDLDELGKQLGLSMPESEAETVMENVELAENTEAEAAEILDVQEDLVAVEGAAFVDNSEDTRSTTHLEAEIAVVRESAQVIPIKPQAAECCIEPGGVHLEEEMTTEEVV